ncbi:unnamed protein product [Ectocarpus fasciculatus]
MEGSLTGRMDQTHKGVAGTAAGIARLRGQDQEITRRVSNFEAEVPGKADGFDEPRSPSATSRRGSYDPDTVSVASSTAIPPKTLMTSPQERRKSWAIHVWCCTRSVASHQKGGPRWTPRPTFGLSRNTLSSASSLSAAPMPALGGSADGCTKASGNGGGNGGNVGGADLVRIGTAVRVRRTVQDTEEESRKRCRRC